MKLYWPVRVEDGAYLGQKFGEHLVDYSPMIGHNGLDFPAPLGTKIYASIDGWIVEQTHKDTGFGLRITQRVEADGKFYQIVYGHMQKLENPVTFAYNWLDKARPIKAGQLIGYVNSTGFSTGNHLHFGVYEQYENGIKINPSNGYGGAEDPEPYLAFEMERPSMGEFIHIKGTPTYGLLYTTEFVSTIVKFTSSADAKEKLANVPHAIKLDGTPNFAMAREITL